MALEINLPSETMRCHWCMSNNIMSGGGVSDNVVKTEKVEDTDVQEAIVVSYGDMQVSVPKIPNVIQIIKDDDTEDNDIIEYMRDISDINIQKAISTSEEKFNRYPKIYIGGLMNKIEATYVNGADKFIVTDRHTGYCGSATNGDKDTYVSHSMRWIIKYLQRKGFMIIYKERTTEAYVFWSKKAFKKYYSALLKQTNRMRRT
jgi:hypothetical protein